MDSPIEVTTDPVLLRAWKLPASRYRVPLPPGVWDNEPDKIQWVDDKTDLDCLMLRSRFGNWCGYVGVARRHPFHGIDYQMINVDVHGGLTFAGLCTPGEPIDGICHIAEPGRETEPWWLGFDCGHYMDYQPGMAATMAEVLKEPTYRDLYETGHYRTVEYVRNEVTELARQLWECR